MHIETGDIIRIPVSIQLYAPSGSIEVMLIVIHGQLTIPGPKLRIIIQTFTGIRIKAKQLSIDYSTPFADDPYSAICIKTPFIGIRAFTQYTNLHKPAVLGNQRAYRIDLFL